MTSDEPEPYVGDVAATNDDHAATQVQGLGSAHTVYGDVGNAVRAALIQAGAEVRTAQWGQAQAARLERGLETQSAPPFGGSNYANYTTTRLCEMVTTNLDPGAVGELGAAWHSLGDTYTAVAQSLGAAVSSSESGWTGTAGDAARTFLTGMANWADLAGQGAQLAGNRTGMQSEAAQAARNSMPTPVEPPTAADVRQVLLSNTLNPATGAAQLDQRFQAAQQAHDQAVQVVQSYDTNLAAVGDTMPAFAVPPTLDPGNRATTRITGSTSHGTESPRSTATGPSAQQNQPSQAPTGQDRRSGQAPPTTALQSSPSGTPETGDSSPAGNAETPGAQDNPGVLGSVGRGTPGAPKAFGPPGLGKAGEPLGSGRVAGPGGSGTRPAPDEAIDRPVTGPDAGADEGMAGVPLGRDARSDEDRDRYPPSYLTNPDPDGTFGISQNVIPPVIGA